MEDIIEEREITYNYMSFTGYKTLLIFSLLINGPKSFSEIADVIKSKKFLKDDVSNDTLRVYINSFKKIGCDVKRVKQNGVSKYYITKHPFTISLSQGQYDSLLKLYKILVKNLCMKDLLCVYNFLEKLGNITSNENFINEIKKISFMKDVDINLLKYFITCCENNYKVNILYNSPNSGEKDIEIVTDKVEIYNNKIYLFGYGMEYDEYCKFPLSRIKKINAVDINSHYINSNVTKIVYKIPNYCIKELDENETIIDKNSTVSTIEMSAENLFIAKQRLLEYGYLCTVISPQQFRNDFVKLLQDMKEVYQNG